MHFASTVELALVTKLQVRQSKDTRAGELTLPPSLATALGELTGTVLKGWPSWCGCREVDWLTNSATSQTQIQGFEMAHRNISSIYDLLG